MKTTIFILLLCSLQAFGQSNTHDSILLRGTILTSGNGIYVCPTMEINSPFNENWILNSRFGMALGLHQENYFFIQNGITYKKQNIFAGMYPTWLRRYGKEIGYQTPCSFVIGYKSPINLDLEIWANYWYKSVTGSVGFVWNIGTFYH